MKVPFQLAAHFDALPAAGKATSESSHIAGKTGALTFAATIAALVGKNAATGMPVTVGAGTATTNQMQPASRQSNAPKQPGTQDKEGRSSSPNGSEPEAEAPMPLENNGVSTVRIANVAAWTQKDAADLRRDLAGTVSKTPSISGSSAAESHSSKRPSSEHAKSVQKGGDSGVGSPPLPAATAIPIVPFVVAPRTMPQTAKGTQTGTGKQLTLEMGRSSSPQVERPIGAPVVSPAAVNGFAQEIASHEPSDATPASQGPRSAGKLIAGAANGIAQPAQNAKEPSSTASPWQREVIASQAGIHGEKAVPRETASVEGVIGTDTAVRTAGHTMSTGAAPQIGNGGAATLVHGGSPAMAGHSQVSATQLLDRMDTASGDATVQMRGDARHLEVGVASGSMGWVEVHATAGPAGKVDAALHLEGHVQAQSLSGQAGAIVEYARQHEVQLGQISVGLGTGDGSRGQSGQSGGSHQNARSSSGTLTRESAPAEEQSVAANISLISVRA